MTRKLAVDQFTQAPARAEFKAFQEGIDRTTETLGLREPDATGFQPLMMGSGALAQQDLDARNRHSDLDVVISVDRFRQLERAGILRGVGMLNEHTHAAWTRRSRDMPLPVELFASEKPEGYTGIGFHGPEPYLGVPNSSTVEIGGLHVLRATVVAANKLLRLHVPVKAFSILQAHVVAVSTEHAIIENEEWRTLVARAVGKVMSNSVDLTIAPRWRQMLNKPAYPLWLKQLKRARFEHPAFENIPRTPVL